MQSALAVRSSFSIGESTLSVEKLIDAAKTVGVKTVALTDTMSVTGLIDFTNRAKKAEIKPIIGVRLRLVDDPAWRKTKENKKTPPEYFVTAYVLSETGLAAVFKLLTLANSEERFYFSAKLGFDDLNAALKTVTADDLAIVVGDIQSLLTHPQAEAKIRNFGFGVYIGLTPINTPYFDRCNAIAFDLLSRLETAKPIIIRPTLYNSDDADATDVMNAIMRGVKMTELWCYTPAYRDLRIMMPAEVAKEAVAMAVRVEKRYRLPAGFSVADTVRQAVHNTDALVASVKYLWKKAPVSLPTMAPDEFKAVVEACKAGFVTRLRKETFGHVPTEKELSTIYMPRLAYELEVLRKLGFSGYFLLVQDIVKYAKSNGILVGPGRGSVGGSLVAYLMGITDCDPLRFGLLFERFINPDRIDLPDADLDFMAERRHEIIDYLIAKYGTDRVAGISNFNSLAAASAIRDVGKACGLSENDVRCSKYAEKLHGQNIKLEKQAEIVPEFAAFRDSFKPIWDVCLKLEGAIRSMGRHAAGVVVGGCDLVERAVIERRKDGATINWDKRIVEDQGLVKVDILGLETLDLIKLATDYIAKRRGKKINLLGMPLNDPKVLENFAQARTTGIFQFESGGMRRLLRELGKDGTITFDDITAATALYRPGPMDSGMMDSYWQRKQGIETVEYDHPNMVETLKPTFGVMVYQEQVMQVARDVAGYSMADADKLRKIMGKKLPEEMKKERGKFVEGCVKTVSMSEADAGNLFDKIEKFAGYGFNKSHSVEYTLISYQAMWLKTYFPVEFFSAALSLMKEEKLPALLKDAKDAGIEVHMPDVNLSGVNFEILTDTALSIPFSRIKGLSSNAAKAIVEARNDGTGPFTSKENFVKRVNRRLINVSKVGILDRIGAFARIEPGQPAATDPSRIKDQRELIPGLIDTVVPIGRSMHNDKITKVELVKLIAEYRTKLEEDGVAVQPVFGSAAKFMVITDAPTNGEEREGRLTMGNSFNYCKEALEEVGLNRSDAYWTSLLKRPKEGKQPSATEIGLHLPFLQREIDLLKPPLIVLLGSSVVRQFFPDFKGKASDQAGKVFYVSKLDANVVIGFNPGEIYHDEDKQTLLNEVFRVVSHILT